MDKIKNVAQSLGIITVEDMERYTALELIMMIANKMNEFKEILNDQNDKIQYLLSKGLLSEVEQIFNEWLQDGTFDALINQSALKKVSDRIDETNAQLSNIIQINLNDYRSFVVGNDWSPALHQAIAENARGRIFIPSSSTPYGFSQPIVLGDEHSLRIDEGATIKAIMPMDVFIKRHGSLDNLTREYNIYNQIDGGGVIDCNGMVKIGISLGGYRGFKINNLTILDMIACGIVTKGENVEYAVELRCEDLNIEVRNENEQLNPTAIKVTSTDNHFYNIFMVDTKVGIECVEETSSNRFLKCHHWMRDRIKNKDIQCKSFVDYGGDNLFDSCYADTSNVGFEIGGSSTLINCYAYNSPHFVASNAVAYYLKRIRGRRVTIMNCRANAGSSATVPVAPICAWKSDVELTEAVFIFNCSKNSLATDDFPKLLNFEASSIHADTIRGGKASISGDCIVTALLDVKGAIEAKTVHSQNNLNADGNVKAKGNIEGEGHIKGSALRLNEQCEITVDSNNVLKLNNNCSLKWVTRPSSSTANGSNGYVAYDDNYFYVYVDGVGWRRTPLSTF